MRSFALICSILVAPLPALAAPFCVVSQTLPPQCLYFDASSCQTNAAKQNGRCTVNLKEVRLVPGQAQYCLVTSARVSQCIYAERSDCDREAGRQQGACVEAIRRPKPGQAVDPYSLIRPY